MVSERGRIDRIKFGDAAEHQRTTMVGEDLCRSGSECRHLG